MVERIHDEGEEAGSVSLIQLQPQQGLERASVGEVVAVRKFHPLWKARGA